MQSFDRVANLEKKFNIKYHPRKSLYTNFDPLFPHSLKYATAKVLLDSGMQKQQIIKRTGLANDTIVDIQSGKIKPLPKIVEMVKHSLSSKLALLEQKILDSIDQEDLNKASLLQKTTAFAQLFDKRRLDSNLSTENVGISGSISNLTDSIGHISNYFNVK